MDITLEYFLYFNISFFVRMVLIFTVMMKYRNWVITEDTRLKKILWTVTKPFWYAIAVVFFIVDIIYNWYSTITFLDKPLSYDETLSYRMDRYVLLYKDRNDLSLVEKWRYFFAKNLCKVLGWSDPKHCGGL